MTPLTWMRLLILLMQLYSIIMDKIAVLDPGLLFKLAFMTSLWPKLKPRLKAERLVIHGQMLSKVPRYVLFMMILWLWSFSNKFGHNELVNELVLNKFEAKLFVLNSQRKWRSISIFKVDIPQSKRSAFDLLLKVYILLWFYTIALTTLN